MNIFHKYLDFCMGTELPPCAFMMLKMYEKNPTEELKKSLDEFYHLLVNSDNIIRYPFLIGYDRHFQKMKNLHTLLNEFKAKKENSLAYAQACFLGLQVMDEMLYDEYRSLSSVFEDVMRNLLSEDVDLEKALLLLAGLTYNYLGPEFLEFVPKEDFDYDLYLRFKDKVKERYPL